MNWNKILDSLIEQSLSAERKQAELLGKAEDQSGFYELLSMELSKIKALIEKIKKHKESRQERSTRSQCYNCLYRREVPGSAHSACGFDFSTALVPPPSFDAHGIRKGWVHFPINFDPVWMNEECKGFDDSKELVDNRYVVEPYESLVRMLSLYKVLKQRKQ